MKLCYTTSLNSGQGPNRPSGSIGGYISELTVRNDEFDNLFGEISVYGASKAKTEYRALALVNDSDQEATDVTLYMTTAGELNQGTLLIAPVAMNRDSEDRPVMERIPDIYSKPFVGDFQATDSENKLNIGTIPANESIGIWICRQINEDNVRVDYGDIAQPLKDKPYWFESVKKETDESWQLNVEWSEEGSQPIVDGLGRPIITES